VATVSITVRHVNQAPVAADQSVATDQETPVQVTLGASDADGDALSFVVVDGPQHGSLGALSGSKLTYTPAAGYSGPDSFTFKANDGALDSNVATVSITVRHVNHPPLAVDDSVMTTQGIVAQANVLANDSDPDGDPLTITASTNGGHGSVTCTTVCTYAPDATFSGSDSFTYTISDGNGGTATASVQVQVLATSVQPDCSTATLRIGMKSLAKFAVDANINGRAEAFRAVAGSTGSVSVLCLYLDAKNTATSLVGGLYGDAGGRPGPLLAQGALATTPANGAFNAIVIPSVPLASGTPYWIALLSPSGSTGALRFRDHCCGIQSTTAQSGPSVNSAETNLARLPSTWSSGAFWPRDGFLLGWGGGS
jgi:hypothetical protein